MKYMLLFYLDTVLFRQPDGLYSAPIQFYEYLIDMLDTGDE